MAESVTPDRRERALARRLRRRAAAERRFRWLTTLAVVGALGFLLVLVTSIVAQGWRGFTETRVAVPTDLAAAHLPVDPARLGGRGADLALAGAGLEGVVDRAADRLAPDLLSPGAWLRVRDAIKRDPSLLGRSAVLDLPAGDALDRAWKGDGTPAAEAVSRRLAPRLSTGLATGFLTGADATDATRAGIWAALKGSLLTMAVTLALAFPVGTLAALYLEEFAPRNRWTDLLEVSINNLAAVPSIIFGLLGLAIFIGAFGLPRSAPLVGGLTLALMTMPVIVIAARAAIRSVPGSVREAALGIGASPVRLVVHHVLPLALPGMLTGTVLGVARALGETAPLLLIGMRAFVAAPPRGFTDPATVLPVQIFLWSDQVSGGFVERTAAAIIVLLALLLAITGVAVTLRNRWEARR